MADTHETVDDIIEEKRRRAEHIRNNLSTVPFRRWDQQAEIKSLEDEADRRFAGRFGWSREEQERHNKRLPKKRAKTAAQKKAQRGGVD